MASGKPFIASNVPGLKDIVEGAALLFTHKNEKDLAEKISSLISSPELYKKVSAACLERSKQYDINIMVDKYIEVYKEVLK
jgi:glycosyltransferase involved in cell wall biosynthesis